MMDLVTRAAGESTCQKRVTVCVIFDASGAVLACESNRCEPEGGTCHRLGIVSVREDYPLTSECNWQHAERRAIEALPEGARPVRAIVYGHRFPCEPCETALRSAGIEHITVAPDGDGIGER